MAEGLDDFEMEELSKKYPEYSTMENVELKDRIYSFHKDLLEMYDKREIDIDKVKKMND